MKKLLLLLLLLPAMAFGQTNQYRPEDKNAMQAFLMQDGAEGKKNYEHLGFTDEPDWTSEEWAGQVLGVTWNDEAPKRLQYISWWRKPNLQGSLDVRTCTNLKEIEISNTKISELLVDGLQDLTYINASNSPVSALSLTNLSALQTLTISKTNISQLDLGNLGNLISLNCGENVLITALDLSSLNKLEKLAFERTSVSQLVLPATNKLSEIKCRYTNLTLATLPEVKGQYTTYLYTSQNQMDGGTTINRQIDLSAQNRNGNTTYTWYVDGNLTTELTDVTGTNGIFDIPAKYGGKTLVCHMTNSDFPDFTTAKPFVCKVEVVDAYHAGDKAALQAFLVQESLRNNTKNWGILGFTAEPDWTTEEWLENSTQLNVDWNTESPKRITGIVWPMKINLAGSLDVSGMTELLQLQCSLTGITEVKAGGLKKLQGLYCGGTKITSLDVSGLESLQFLTFFNTQVSEINLDGLDQLLLIECYNTPINKLVLDEAVNLQALHCYGTNLTLETLPAPESFAGVTLPTNLKYAPLNVIDGGKATGWQIDLSKQNRNGNTTYKWYVEGDLANELTDITGSNGIFNIPSTYAGKNLVCRMTNTDYPQFDTDPLTYKIATMDAYHADDRAALQAFLVQESAVAGKKNYEYLGYTTEPDWESEEWVENSTQLGIEWNTESPKRITYIRWSITKRNLAGSLDVSGMTELLQLQCTNTQISEMKVGGLKKLQALNCGGTKITALDVSGLENLQQLTFPNTQVSEIDLDGLDQLLLIECYNTPINKLDVSGIANLQLLHCYGTNLTLETLPSPESFVGITSPANLKYAPLNEIDGGTASGWQIDLSAQNRNGNTTYTWYVDGDLSNELTDITGTNGKFDIPAKYGGKSLVCQMTNTDYPQFDADPLTYKITAMYAYHADDKAALQAFLVQDAEDGKKNYEHLGLATEPDWTSEEWVEQLQGVTWNTATPKRISVIRWNAYPELEGSLDLRNCASLQHLYCSGNNISSLNVSGLRNLENVYCNNTPIDQLDVSSSQFLLSLVCSNTLISQLDLSNKSYLKNFECAETPISQLNLSGLTRLTYLDCNNTQLTELDASGLSNLENVYCNNTPISSLDVTNTPALTILQCANTNLTLATLPVSAGATYESYYVYAPQNEIDGGTIETEADLSGQNRNGNTTYKWYVDGDLSNELTDIIGIGGIFNIPSKYAGETLVCQMTNSDFPQFGSNPLTYKATVSPSVSVGEQLITSDKVYAQDGELHVEAAEAGMLQVYDTMGRLYVSKQLPAGENILPLESGSYIVLFNNQRVKIVMK